MIWKTGMDLGVSNGGYRMIASMRLEKGYADWGSELTPEYTPFDAGLGFCVALDKGDFIGRDALVKVKKEGPQYKLCTFTIDVAKPLVMQNSAPIIYKGEVLGVTTSVGYGHTLGKNICFAYLPIEHVGPEDGFEIESYGETYAARLELKRALYDPERKKILM
jgi:4-methylaminobutanoate oxidase (formaldehyde-forming)